MPSATSKPAAVTLLTLFDTTFIFWVRKHAQQMPLYAGRFENQIQMYTENIYKIGNVVK